MNGVADRQMAMQQQQQLLLANLRQQAQSQQLQLQQQQQQQLQAAQMQGYPPPQLMQLQQTHQQQQVQLQHQHQQQIQQMMARHQAQVQATAAVPPAQPVQATDAATATPSNEAVQPAAVPTGLAPTGEAASGPAPEAVKVAAPHQAAPPSSEPSAAEPNGEAKHDGVEPVDDSHGGAALVAGDRGGSLAPINDPNAVIELQQKQQHLQALLAGGSAATAPPAPRPGTVGLQPVDPALLEKIREQQQAQLREQQSKMLEQAEQMEKQRAEREEQQQVLARSPALRQMQQQAQMQQQQLRQHQMMQVQQVPPMQHMQLQQLHTQQQQQLRLQHNAQLQHAQQMVLQQHAAAKAAGTADGEAPADSEAAQPAPAVPEMSTTVRTAIELMAKLIARNGESFREQMINSHRGDADYDFLSATDTPEALAFRQRLDELNGVGSEAAAPSDAPAAAAAPSAEVDEGWLELADDAGRPYYVNRKLNVTTWVKPEEMVRQEAAGTAGTKRGRHAAGWTEYKMENGRAYYCHAERGETQWTTPAEFEGVPDDEGDGGAAEGAAANGDDDGEGGADSKRAKKEQRRREREAARALEGGSAGFVAEAEAVREQPLMAAKQAQSEIAEPSEAFTAMLSERARTNPQVFECEWEDAMRFFVVDRRYGAVKTLEKRKELFAAWQQARHGEADDARRALAAAARRAFVELLRESHLDADADFEKAERRLSAAPRWQALEAEQREAAFDEAMVAVREEARARQAQHEEERRRRAEALAELLRAQGVGAADAWAEVSARREVAADERFGCMEADEREAAFAAFQRALLEEQRDEATSGFVAMLWERQRAGVLGRKVKWREAEQLLHAEAPLAALRAISTEAPHAAYDTFLAALRRRFVRHALRARAVAVRCGAALSSADDFASFKEKLEQRWHLEAEQKAAAARAKQSARAAARAAAEARDAESETLVALRAELRGALGELEAADREVWDLEVAAEDGAGGAGGAGGGGGGGGSGGGGGGGGDDDDEVAVGDLLEEALRAVHTVTLERLREADADAGRRRRRAERRFRELLESVREMATSGTSFAAWERVREAIQGEPSFALVESDDERARMWREYVAELEAGAKDKGRRADRGDAKERRRKDDKKRRRRSASPSSSSDSSSDSSRDRKRRKAKRR